MFFFLSEATVTHAPALLGAFLFFWTGHEREWVDGGSRARLSCKDEQLR